MLDEFFHASKVGMIELGTDGVLILDLIEKTLILLIVLDDVLESPDMPRFLVEDRVQLGGGTLSEFGQNLIAIKAFTTGHGG